MAENIKPKEATAIINSLLGGVVPKVGVQHITVGRTAEINAVLKSLDDVANGHSLVKFWIGDYGSGKSFMLHVLNTVAMKKKFVVAKADFTPVNSLYSNEGKAVALYSSIMNNIAIQTKPDGGALPILLEKWIEQVITKTASQNGISLEEIKADKYHDLIRINIMKTINKLSDEGSFDFGNVILMYYEGYISDNEQLSKNALRWLKGEYKTKSDARWELGKKVREIINGANYYDMLKNFCKLFVSIGYSGFMINLDEAINLYKITNGPIREKNYEKILTIYNDCLQGKVANLFINFAGTKEFLENERKGLFSYQALKSRLELNKHETAERRDFAQPVIKLMPLSNEEIFVLLQKLVSIFNQNYGVDIQVKDDDILIFMEEMLNKPGAKDFLTPREIIREFLNILSILRQYPTVDKSELIKKIAIKDERPAELLPETIEEI